MPFLFVAGRLYGPDAVGRYALAVVVIELGALIATLGLKRGLALALAKAEDAQQEIRTVWDALLLALIAGLIIGGFLFAIPQVMFPDGVTDGFDRWFALTIIPISLSDVALAALAYRRNIKASVTARAIIEPWTISVAVLVYYYVARDDGLTLAYMTALTAAMIASLVPMLRSYGLPRGWRPHLGRVAVMARRNAPLAGAETIEWGTRNVDRFILGMVFEPRIVGIYYMAQQISSIPQKLKSSFDPILGPVITQSLAKNDRAAIAQQVRQVGFWIMSAQAIVALMGSIPGEAVMGLIGPQFVAGTAALAFLLWGEVLATQGAVSEAALVYMARHFNLAISIFMLGFQIALSFALIHAIRALGYPVNYQAAGPAIALLLSLTMTSLIKAGVLRRMLGARVLAWRWSFLAAIAASVLVGTFFTWLPKRLEWAELLFGEPALVGAFLFVVWRYAFKPEDRTLFKKLPGAGTEPITA
ncbi:oligosaccharide flippase family protein [Sphingomonas panacisoli]|uniref:Oligosaccharide flippase family protein n=1 Tax=Sphingomonas panacisoli TaxID=1813879 RepID=A0A5B8LNN2_9SPHN|nr:oligosaccharide flippase family protein [Sphingomonas panacisoli]QDZ08982.1 oligosaccharide flippase family protein [Sphingomonas panacisoli]